ncbi:MAG: GNAT family N-acetyltransferase [Myxococcota bacterium]|nr:GNAT family N-acetyltransferase [Myxococcota bacterium]
MSSARIRPARPDELVRLQAIEEAAGALFATVGMPEVDAAEPVPLGRLEDARQEGRLWVAADAADRPVGFALVETVDGEPHLKEVDVHPDHGRRGVGRRLVEHVLARARAEGAAGVTLTTYRDVAWNAPFYRRLGFRELPEPALGPGLARIRRLERERGLDAAGPRVAMRRTLDPADPA